MSAIAEYLTLFDLLIVAVLIALMCCGLWGKETG
ncbi:hypothetical protein GGQ67_001795 [Rhizobium metallidurans]|uniref:Uncharacterized protein n=1 Tax=Rhizobium metallidurans TaxID=1265931 RepID=A0A7W6CPP3_9HYPH|nr:hypothetical protein [Rhizobium metallidurans]